MLTAQQKQDLRMKKLNEMLQSSFIGGMFYKQFPCLQPDNSSVQSMILYGTLEKQSQTGLFFNSRFLFMISPGVIKFRNSEPTEMKLDENNHPKVTWKKQYNVNDIQSFSLEGKNITINIKNVKQPWVFRAKDAKKAQSWLEKLQKGLKLSQNPQIIVNQNPLAFEESVAPRPQPLRQKKVKNNPVIIHPKSTLQIYQQQYAKVLKQFEIKQRQEDRKLQICKKDPVFDILSIPQDILLTNFQKQAIKYFRKLIDQSQVDHQSSLKFDVQFYSSLQKQDFDNLSYLYEKTYNLGSLRVIPSILLCYKGVRGLVRYKLSHLKQTNNNSGIIKLFKSIEDRTRVQAPNFQNSENTTTVLEYFEIDVSVMNSILKLESQKVYIVNSLMGYIPVGELPITAQLLKRKDFLGQVLDYEDTGSQFVRNVVQECKKQLLSKLDKMTILVCNSLELNKIILKSGLSRFHLRELYEESTLDYTKSLILSEMAIMIISEILSQNLQTIESRTKNALVADLLNLIIGGTNESKLFWEQVIMEHIEKRFGIVYKRKEINVQYILAGVIEHNGVIINYQRLKQNKTAFPSEYISVDDIEGFKVIYRGYSILFNDKYSKVQQLISNKRQESFVELVQMLNLKYEPIPDWLVQSSLYQGVVLLLASFIPPTTHNSQPYHHLNIYKKNYFTPVTSFDFEILKIQLNWCSLQGKQSEIQLLFQLFLQKLTFWIGDYSPIHGQLYLQMAKLSLKKKNYSDASALIESAVLNFSRLDGMFSFKLIDCYSMLAESQHNPDDAISNYERAKKISQNYSQQQQPFYLSILFNLAELYYKQQRFQESIILYFQCINYAQKLEQQQIKIKCFSMLSRCYIAVKDPERHSLLFGHALMLLQKMNHKQYFAQLLKVCIATSVLKQSKQASELLKQIVQNINIIESLKDYQESVEYLMQNRSEIESFTEFLCSEEYLYSLSEQYKLSSTQPKMMIYHIIQVLGQKMFK